jgi:hypothetical protein
LKGNAHFWPMVKFSQQRIFFAELRKLMPAHYNMANWIMRILGITNSTAHKKIRGEVALGFDELGLICQDLPEAAYLIPDLLHLTDSFVALRPGINREFDLDLFLDRLLDFLRKLQKKPNAHIYLICRDLSLFLILSRPELLTFKAALWSNAFSSGSFPKLSSETLKKSGLIMDLYRQIPSTELWFVHSVNHFYTQLACTESSGFILGYQKDKLTRELNTALYQFRGMPSGLKQIGTIEFCLAPSCGLFSSDEVSYVVSSAAEGKYFFSKDSGLIVQFWQTMHLMKRFSIPLDEAPFYKVIPKII